MRGQSERKTDSSFGRFAKNASVLSASSELFEASKDLSWINCDRCVNACPETAAGDNLDMMRDSKLDKRASGCKLVTSEHRFMSRRFKRLKVVQDWTHASDTLQERTSRLVRFTREPKVVKFPAWIVEHRDSRRDSSCVSGVKKVR